jgi:hypothetical protein
MEANQPLPEKMCAAEKPFASFDTLWFIRYNLLPEEAFFTCFIYVSYRVLF